MGKAPFRRTWATINRPDDSPKRYISHILQSMAIQRWALPASLAVTEGILVSFFSSA